MNDVADVYNALDIFVFPSLAEPLGTSLLTAMAYALPVVAVNSGGVPEVIEPGSGDIAYAASSPEEIMLALP